MYEDILQLTPLPSIQDPRAPNSSSPVLSSSSSSSYRASSPVTPALRPLSLPVAVSEASLPPLQREEVGCGCDVVPVPLHHHSRELRTERPGAQPSPLQVGSVKCLENTALKSGSFLKIEGLCSQLRVSDYCSPAVTNPRSIS